MNTSSLKKFAVSAREKLMNGVADKILALGFDKKGNVEEKNMPQRMGSISSLWIMMAQTPMMPPIISDPVSPINTCAG